MCGIVGVVSNAPVNQLIYDGLLLLQHRGQDAAGIVTQLDRKFFMHKAKGMVRDVFRTRNMRALPGNVGLGQVRYPTAGNAFSEDEAQPFYVNAPFGLVLSHNGNLTNAAVLKAELFNTDHRHINTDSDSEVLLNVLAHELEKTTRGLPLKPVDVFAAVRGVHKRIKGSYAVVALIAGHGLLAFRDPYGIRPLCLGRGQNEQGGTVITQYNRPGRDIKTDRLAPYALTLGGNDARVTDEDAAITLLEPNHPAFNVPNKLTPADWTGWVQERGAYFGTTWGPEFTPLLACNDAGESPQRGGLLVARHGKGYYVYTGLGFFRQLPAGVPGAYRLFANLISLRQK